MSCWNCSAGTGVPGGMAPGRGSCGQSAGPSPLGPAGRSGRPLICENVPPAAAAAVVKP